MQKCVFIGHNALGDTLCTTPVLHAFRRLHPDAFIIYVVQNAGFCRILDGNPDIDLVLYNEWMYLHGMTRYSPEWLASLPLDLQEQAMMYHFDICLVCSKLESFHEHISIGFSKLLNVPIDSIRPRVIVREEERKLARRFTPRPYVLLGMHSVSNPARPDGQSGGIKDWPVDSWGEIARDVRDMGDFDVIAIGSEKDPQKQLPYVRNLYGLPIKVVAALIEGASSFITVESGLAHLAAGVDASTVLIYPSTLPLGWANPAESTRTRVFYGDPLELSPDKVSTAIERSLLLRSAAV